MEESTMCLRRHKRFTPKRRSYVAFTRGNRNGPVQQSEIVDMSMGGAALKYVSKGESNRPGEDVFLEIFGVSMAYVIVEKIRCRVVYDVPMGEFPTNALKLRRCGLEFQDLNQLQSYLIGHYIEHFSRDEEVQKATVNARTS